MEYIEGKELKEIVGTQDVMPLPDVLNYATQIAEGLQAAHKKGITHRDIKSGNIMITEDGQLKIMDFGLAKIAGGAQLTKDHSTLGTAAYMSPEQARGEPVDHRADVWSFGVVLYEMLTGQLPFKGDYEQAVIYSIMNEEPNPLSNLPLETPESLQGVVLRALAKDAAERFQSMDAIVAELKEIQTKSFRTETFLKPRLTGRFSKHARSAIVAGSIVLAVGIILALIFYVQPFSTPKAKFSSIAIMPLVQENGPSEEQSWIADAIVDLLYTELAQYQSIGVLTARERHTIMKNLGIPDDANLSLEQCFQIAQKANSEGIILANLIMSQDTLTIYDVRIFETASTRLVDRIGPIQGQVNQIYDTVDKLSSEIKQLINLGTSTKAKSANALARTPASLDAYRYYLEGRDAALDNRYKDAIPKLSRAINLDSTFVQAYYYLAWQYTKIYESDKAKAVLSKGKPYVENLPEKERLRYLSHEASIDRRWRDYITYIESLIKISPSSASLCYQYGYVQFLFFRKVDIAISSLQKSLKYDSTITDAYKTLGYVHLAKGEKDKAFQYIEEYVRLKPTDVEPLLSLADVQILTGLYREALRNCDKILTAQPDYQRALYYIAQAYFGQGKNSKAIETTNHYLDEVSVPSYRADGHVLLSRIYFSEDNLIGSFRTCGTGHSTGLRLFGCVLVAWTHATQAG